MEQLTIEEKLKEINNIKELIKDAIIEKGGEVTDFASYPLAISDIKTGDNRIVSVECSNVPICYGDTITITFAELYINNITEIHAPETYSFSMSYWFGSNYDYLRSFTSSMYNNSKLVLVRKYDNASMKGPIEAGYIFIKYNDNYLSYIPIEVQLYLCFIKGTKITLADFSQKNVEDITENDILLCWNFDEGKFAFEKPFWIKKTQVTNHFKKITLEDDTEITLTGSNGNVHSLFDLETNKFVHANELLGHRVKTTFGESKVVKIEDIDIEDEFYNIMTYNHINLYANNILASSATYNNLYPIENMKFVYTNKFDNGYKFEGIPECYVEALRLRENKRPEEQLIKDVKLRIELDTTLHDISTLNYLLVLIKPGFDNKADYILNEFIKLGWELIDMHEPMMLTDDMCKVLWSDCDEYIYNNITEHCKSDVVIPMYFKKFGCEMHDYRKLKNTVYEIRNILKTDKPFVNAIHTSDSTEEAINEYNVLNAGISS